jgi:carboxypeptidase C (cathepsin A)
MGQSLYDNFVASNDVIQPSTGYIEALLNRGVKVLIYAGRWDFICNWVANLMMSESLEWDGQEGFSNSELREWKLVGSDDVIGWSKSSGLLHFVVVDGAGHMVSSILVDVFKFSDLMKSFSFPCTS